MIKNCELKADYISANRVIKPFRPLKAVSFGAMARDSLNISSAAKLNFIPITPPEALNLSFNETLQKISEISGKTVDLNKTYNSPASAHTDSNWIKKAKIMAINPLMLTHDGKKGNFFDIVKVALTFPDDTIHLLPLIENDGSIYAQSNWFLNKKLLSPELTQAGFDTPEKQLKVAVNLLHALGKNVGFDVPQHVERFSYITLMNPDLFCWTKIEMPPGTELTQNRDKISVEVKNIIRDYIKTNGAADGSKLSPKELLTLFEMDEEKRFKIIFGDPEDNEGMLKRKMGILRALTQFDSLDPSGYRYETVPVACHSTEHLPEVTRMHNWGSETNPNVWPVFEVRSDDALNVTEKKSIYGSVSPYKFFELNDDGSYNLAKPVNKAFKYFVDHWTKFQNDYNFDFIRADMAHRTFWSADKDQMESVKYHWKALKENIQKKTPHFASFGEIFLYEKIIPRPFIPFIKDAILKGFDAILGDIQSHEGSNLVKRLAEFLGMKGVRPAITINTADHDNSNNINGFKTADITVKQFMAYFINSVSYSNIGTEVRDELNAPPKTDAYRYFLESYNLDYSGQKPYIWGNNELLFSNITRIRTLYNRIKDKISSEDFHWLKTDQPEVAAWGYTDKKKNYSCLFTVNTGKNLVNNTQISLPEANKADFQLIGSIRPDLSSPLMPLNRTVKIKGRQFTVTNLAPGEGRIYKSLV